MLNKLTIIIFIIFAVYVNNLYAQDEFQKYVEKVGETQIEGYFKPFAEAFNTGIHSGLYHTAATHGIGGFDVTIKGSSESSCECFKARVVPNAFC